MSFPQANQPQTAQSNIQGQSLMPIVISDQTVENLESPPKMQVYLMQHQVITMEPDELQHPLEVKDQDFKSVFGESDRISMMEDRNEWDQNQSQVQVKSRSGKRCFNIKCQSTKNIRKLKSRAVASKYRNLCNTCYQDYINNQFCQFCQQIYKINEADDNNWMGCDQCDRWNHVSCQYKKRNKNAFSIKQQNGKYLCLQCTALKKQKNQSRKQKPVQNQQDCYQYQKPRMNKRTIRQQHNQEKNDQYHNSNPNCVNIFSRPKQITFYLDAFLHSINNYKLFISDSEIRQDLKRMKDSIYSKQTQRVNDKGK